MTKRAPMPRKRPSIVAEVCLYQEVVPRVRDHRYAYLATGPDLEGGILAEGGWDPKEPSRIADVYDTLTECIDAAKRALRARGLRSGELSVTFPWGTESARTPLVRFQEVRAMKLGRARPLHVSAARVRRVANRVAQPPTPEELALRARDRRCRHCGALGDDPDWASCHACGAELPSLRTPAEELEEILRAAREEAP
ncbi:MAG: hypothetical protein K8H88_33270 [Sandaracinaceae bacterium]|nr:hypothetical protein [Sandaracinaceae bacterium]